MATTTFNEDIYCNRTFAARTLIPSAGCVGNEHIANGAGIAATKLQQQVPAVYSQKHGSAVVTERMGVYIVRGLTGQIVDVAAALVVACTGAGTVTVDVLKNGVSVLTGVISFDNGEAAFAVLSGTLTGSAPVDVEAEDVIEVDVVATAGGGAVGQGLTVRIITREDANT